MLLYQALTLVYKAILLDNHVEYANVKAIDFSLLLLHSDGTLYAALCTVVYCALWLNMCSCKLLILNDLSVICSYLPIVLISIHY